MRSFLGTLLILVIVVGVVGLARGWFRVDSRTEADKTKVEILLDKGRVRQDTDRVKEEVHELSERIKAGAGDVTNQPSPTDKP